MLMPKRVKFRRPHRVSYEGKAKGAKKVDFGDYGLQALSGCWLTQQQIEAARIAMTRFCKREGGVFIRIFPHISQTHKPLEVRMGGGKGSPDGYVAVVKRGTVMFEIGGVPEATAKEALRLAAQKLPIKCKVISKEVGE